jgi:putative ABC transport system permease protein
MTAGPVLRAARAGLISRRVQTLVVFIVLLASTAAAMLGLTLLTSANEGFAKPFAKHHGADLAVLIDTARVTPGQLAASMRLPEVTKASGPYPAATVTLRATEGGQVGRSRAASPGMTLVVVGRASRGGPLDDVALNSGRWPTKAGEVALAVYVAPAPLGSTLTATDVPGKPKLTVVGTAGSPARDAEAWVTPAEVTELRARGAAREQQVLYDFKHAGSDVQMNSDLRTLERALPRGAIVASTSWLLSEQQTNSEQSIDTPFVVAFGLIALVLSVLIVVSVVSGAVVAGYRRIGILKSIGFTPAQVALAYIAQIAVPTMLGCAIGTFLGRQWVAPLLRGVPDGGSAHIVPAWITITVPVGMCLLVFLAASIPATRAGRLSVVSAIARAAAPAAGHGYRAHRIIGKLALPRSITIGLAAPFSRPSRSTLTIAAITFAVTAVTLAVALNTSLSRVSQDSKRGQGAVQIYPGGSRSSFTATQQDLIRKALHDDVGTAREVAVSSPPLSLPGVPQPVTVSNLQIPLNVTSYGGSSRWVGWDLISGRWYAKPGEIVVNTSFLTQTDLKLGDTVKLTADGHTINARIVGQVFLPNLPSLFTSRQTFGSAQSILETTQYNVDVRAGTEPRAYARTLQKALGPRYIVSLPEGSAFGRTDTSLIRNLTAIILVLAALGVLNTLLMVTRERVHDLGIFKALGMTPRQTITTVICWVIAPAVAAAIIAIPAAIVLHIITLDAIGRSQDTGIPNDVIHVFTAPQLILLAFSGLAVAATGAVLPAAWAAKSRTATALRTE